MTTRVAVMIAVAVTAAVVLAGAALAVALTDRGGPHTTHTTCNKGSVYACIGGSRYSVP